MAPHRLFFFQLLYWTFSRKDSSHKIQIIVVETQTVLKSSLHMQMSKGQWIFHPLSMIWTELWLAGTMDWDVTIQGPSQWEHCTQNVSSGLPRQNSSPNFCPFTPLGRPMRRPRIFLQPTYFGRSFGKNLEDLAKNRNIGLVPKLW